MELPQKLGRFHDKGEPPRVGGGSCIPAFSKTFKTVEPGSLPHEKAEKLRPKSARPWLKSGKLKIRQKSSSRFFGRSNHPCKYRTTIFTQLKQISTARIAATFWQFTQGETESFLVAMVPPANLQRAWAEIDPQGQSPDEQSDEIFGRNSVPSNGDTLGKKPGIQTSKIAKAKAAQFLGVPPAPGCRVNASERAAGGPLALSAPCSAWQPEGELLSRSKAPSVQPRPRLSRLAEIFGSSGSGRQKFPRQNSCAPAFEPRSGCGP